MEKELHIWLGKDHPSSDLCVSLETTEKVLHKGYKRVDTVQPHVCSTYWLQQGYRIFTHMLDGETVEMKLGKIGDNPKEIRVAHNLEKMLLANCFGLATRDYL